MRFFVFGHSSDELDSRRNCNAALSDKNEKRFSCFNEATAEKWLKRFEIAKKKDLMKVDDDSEDCLDED